MVAFADQWRVEIAFATDPDDPAPAWVNVSSYVDGGRPIQVQRGRQDELSQIRPGQMTGLTLRNTDGRFTPGRAGSPYYPGVKLRRRIRLSYLPTSGGTDVRFDGYVDEWDVSWPQGGQEYSEVRVAASDRLKRLATSRQLDSVPALALRSTGPTGLFLLTETGGESGGDTSGVSTSPAVVIAAPGSPGYAPGAINLGAVAGPPSEPRKVASFQPTRFEDGSTSGKLMVAGGSDQKAPYYAPTVNGGAWSWHIAFSTNYPVNAGIMAVGVRGYSIQQTVFIAMLSDGSLVLSLTSDTDGTIVRNLAVPGFYRDGATHSVAVVSTGDDLPKVYVDGALKATATQTFRTAATRNVFIGGTPIGGVPGHYGPFAGALSHVAVWNRALTTAEVALIAAAVVTGFSGDSSGDRLRHLVQIAGLPASVFVGDAGSEQAMAPIDTLDKSVLDVALLVADTEGGLFFARRDGTLAFLGRSDQYNTTPALTTTAEQAGGGLQFVLDEQQIVNDATASRPDGATARAVDAASVASYGPITTSLTLYTLSDNSVADAAAWAVLTHAQPAVRSQTAPFDLITLPSALAASLRSLDLSDVITIGGLPSQAPAPSLSFFVEGLTETIGAAVWDLDLNTSPTSIYPSVFVLESSALDGADVLAR